MRAWMTVLWLMTVSGITWASGPTDLGDVGNRRVAEEFQNYIQKFPNGLCHPHGQWPRVIVTGFHLFDGVGYNISGTVVHSLMKNESDHAITDLESLQVSHQEVEIHQKNYEICFLILIS